MQDQAYKQKGGLTHSHKQYHAEIDSNQQWMDAEWKQHPFLLRKDTAKRDWVDSDIRGDNYFHLLHSHAIHCCRTTRQKTWESSVLPGLHNRRSSFYFSAHKKGQALFLFTQLFCRVVSQGSAIFTHFWSTATRLLTSSLMATFQMLFSQDWNMWVCRSNGTMTS